MLNYTFEKFRVSIYSLKKILYQSGPDFLKMCHRGSFVITQ